ncbi:hypothetical protein ENUP19_0012G0003 [Entamoeba nuttalli]|uniref:Transcriptional adaptor ADA2 n=1 Tax=Entamoeba nuttalli TaxID=412467 RepID=A0ABQ0D865_9EUKA
MALYCPWEHITCNSCNKVITTMTRITCVECDNFDLCLECFSQGKEIGKHKNNHSYRVIPSLHFPLLSSDWGADEELMLLEAIEQKGLDNWPEVENFVKTKTAKECRSHYYDYYLNSKTHPLPDLEESFLKKNGIVDMKPSRIVHFKDDEFDSRPQKETGCTQPTYEGYDASFNPYRREFAFEYFNNAELSICNIAFTDKDTPEEREMKLHKLEEYYKMYCERVRIRNIVINQELVDPKKLRIADRKRSKEEKELHDLNCQFLVALGKEDFEKYIKALVEESKLKTKIRNLKQKRRDGCLTLQESKSRRKINTYNYTSELKQVSYTKPSKHPH